MADYDLFVIGAGSGGVRSARMAASYGAKVGICEESVVGGTCVIRGCIPKKLFVYSSHVSGDMGDAAGFGWSVDGLKFDWPTLVANKDAEIGRLNGLYKQMLSNSNVDLFESRGVLKDAHTIDLGDRQIRADKILISTGGWPVMPDIPGIEHAISSNEAFHLEHLPKRIVIVGGGYISVEFSGIFNGLGSVVTQLYRSQQILRGFDWDIRNAVAEEMRKKGINLRVEVPLIELIEKRESDLLLTLASGETIETDAVMYAIGRNPNSAELGLEELGVALNDKGAVIVDDDYRTSIDSIFALGDVTDRFQLTPVAIAEAMAFTSTQFDNCPTQTDYRDIPTAVFCQPPVGSVGLNEEEARQTFSGVEIYRSDFRPLKHTLSGSDERTMMKLIVDKASDRVVGAHMVGADAGEIIQGLGIALKCGATKAQLDATVAVHPTAAEEYVTMREPIPET